MTDQNSATEAGRAETTSVAASYETLAALRDAHLALRRALSGSTERRSSGGTAQVRAFLTSARKTGAFLGDAQERRAAQTILDYWSAELAASATAQSDDFATVLLDQYDPSRVHRDGDQPAPADKAEQRALIRLLGLARQWRDSGKRRGYLLQGDTIKEAARYASQDPALAEFVEASKDAAGRKRLYLAAFGGAVCAAALSIAGFFYWQFYVLPGVKDAKISELKRGIPSDKQNEVLRWLHKSQPWLPPYDLSGARPLMAISLPEHFTLYAPNFSTVTFSSVSLAKVNMPAASFNNGTISFTEGQNKELKNEDMHWNEFSEATLTLAQYMDASISTTSFAGADLYRAVFDRAQLCDVNFGHADLSSASFWGAAIDEKTYAWLRKTAWWVAVGWNSDDLEKLQSDPPSAEDLKWIRERLKKSERFKRDVERPIAKLGPDTFERAVALNDMAWSLATWGIDDENLPSEAGPCDAQAKPTNALDAAHQAICIIEYLKAKEQGSKAGGSEDRDYDYWLANFRDTQAYVLMQASKNKGSTMMEKAKSLYELDLERTKNDEGALFRYAVAEYALGQKTEALGHFDAVMRSRYVLTHEFQNLRDQIPRDVITRAYEIINDKLPRAKKVLACEK